MKVCVFGLWHLGSVTAGCLAAMGVETVGLDPSAENIADLAKGVPPLHEPGLPDLLQQGIRTGKLRFTDDVAAAVSDADIVWVAFDTPVDDDDNADVAYVQRQIERTFPHLKSGAGVLVSSQMPVGSVAALEKTFAKVADGRSVEFASSPENLRLGRAIEIFRNPGRIIAGVRGEEGRCRLEPLLASICGNLTWVRVESAEMTKHALNSFLAVCITFANEVATVCERVGADAGEVELSIRSDPRVGMQSYVTPGAAFAGGTLARDVRFLEGLARREGMTLPMLG
ncbi:MAG TPA: nucleotide sugar dehydrogenase, partial [Rhizorhapis sp.]|nr:nucleotide sugar dehydrogenase [Rhizorhapis sp.]